MVRSGVMPLYYHMNRLGSAILLTSGITGQEASEAEYDEWGNVDADIIKCGEHELDMVQRYATHDYDSVLDLYYAKARMYAAELRRFDAVDPILDGSQYEIKGDITNPMQLVQYLYVVDNPLVYVDPTGLAYVLYMRDLTGNTLAEKEVSFDTYCADGLLHVKEVEELIKLADGYDANADYDKDANATIFDVKVDDYTYRMIANIDDMNIKWLPGLGKQITVGNVYFNHYDCFRSDRTLVDIESLGQLIGVEFEIVHDESYGWRFIGGGLQFEISIPSTNLLSGTFGAEAVFFSDMNLSGNNSLIIPDIFVYTGFSGSSDYNSLASYILKDPQLLTNSMSKIVNVSGAIFAIYGNDEFTSVSDYNGGFKSVGGSIAGYKGFLSWSGSCRVIGAGKDTATFSVSYSETDYTHIVGENGFTSEFAAIAYKVKQVAESIPFQ